MRPLSRPRLRWVIRIGGFLVAATFSLGLLSPQRQAMNEDLVRYISPPLDKQGTRVECLQPAGWRLQHFRPLRGHSVFVVGPSDRLARVRGWLPPRFQGWLPRPEQGRLSVHVLPVIHPRDKRAMRALKRARGRSLPGAGSPMTYAGHSMLSKDERYMVHATFVRYSVPEQEVFDRTFERIVGSMNIAPVVQ